MPILQKEPDFFPATLFDEQPDGASAATWWAVHTLARREKDLVRRLRTMEITHYCPQIRKRFRSPSGRVRESYIPLFPGYVFMRGGEAERYQALTSNCISQCLPVPDPAQLTTELGQIHRLLESQLLVLPELRLEPGQAVRVKSGPMMGMEGTVLRRHSKTFFVVAVNFLQQGAAVMLEDYQLEIL